MERERSSPCFFYGGSDFRANFGTHKNNVIQYIKPRVFAPPVFSFSVAQLTPAWDKLDSTDREQSPRRRFNGNGKVMEYIVADVLESVA